MLVAIFACLLICIATLTHAGGTDIPLDFYTDNACATPSTTAANISLELGVCSVTPGLGSFVLQPYPCSSGDVVQYAFSDTACGQPKSASRTSIEGYCYAEAEGGDIAAIMLSCDQTSPGQPTSTTTITVGPIATGGSNSSTSSTTGSGDGSSSSSDSSSPASGWNSLSLPVRIVIIVGVSVSVLSAILGGSYEKRRRNAAHPYVVPLQQTDRTYTETIRRSWRGLA
jgi:hypothetical protein